MSTTTQTQRTSVASENVRRYQAIRDLSVAVAAPLEIEETGIQSMPDASPIRWHLAHTTWFFETFVLKDVPGYRSPDERFEKLFNSYYNGVGEPFPREQRGMIGRPTLADVMAYRGHVDDAMAACIADASPDVAGVIEIGLNHEQQHQELMVTDLKHALSINPLHPIYRDDPPAKSSSKMSSSGTATWTAIGGGIHEIGHTGGGFAFDNESPRHRVFLNDFQFADSLVTNGQWIDFIDAGGYQSPQHWLSMGWSWVRDHAIAAPLYWHRIDGRWHHFTLAGLIPVDPDGVLTHVSYFEADAYARSRGCRLPTEAEWEIAAGPVPVNNAFLDEAIARGVSIHPSFRDEGRSVTDSSVTGPRHCFGTVWQWTASAYDAYPGYQPADGTLGEYNGKFMCQQFVLRGGSCATPGGHLRATYRNFFPPTARWQFTGVRLAR